MCIRDSLPVVQLRSSHHWLSGIFVLLDLSRVRSFSADDLAVLFSKPKIRLNPGLCVPIDADILRHAETGNVLGHLRRIAPSSQLQRQFRAQTRTRSDMALVAAKHFFTWLLLHQRSNFLVQADKNHSLHEPNVRPVCERGCNFLSASVTITFKYSGRRLTKTL